MEVTQELIKQLISVGMLGYSIDKIINVIDVPENDVQWFTREFNNKNSEIYQAYKKGMDKADYVLDMKLFQKAQDGDLKALEKYEQRKSFR